jgi:apolipoprotein N-acyltransferase
MILPLFGLGCVLVFGFHQLRFEQPRERVLRAALVQPSIPQTLIWDSDKDEERFQSVVALTKTIGPDKVDLLIWPEAAVPKLLRYDPESLDVITNLARSFHAWMIIGADDKEPRAGTLNIHEADYYNSSFLIDPKGRLINRYRKRGLVIFGEYVPLQHTLPFLKYLTPIPGSYTSGDKPVQFDLEDQNIRTAVLICFEDIFPHLAREYVDDDTDLLINLTNNGWFGESASQWQHGLSALFRAIENNVPLIRCSNNGLTCWIDERGRIKQMFRDATDRIYGPGILYATVPLPAHGTHTPTFYHRHGDLFGWVCTGFSALYFLPPMFRFRTAKT